MSEPSPGAAPPVPAAARGLSGPGAVALAGAGVAGALWAHPFPLLVAAALTAVGLLVRRASLLVVGVLLLVSTLAARSWAGIDMVASAPWSGIATLVTDPEVDFGAVHAVVEIDGRRVEAWARGGPGAALRGRLAGERLWTSGTLRPLRGSAAARLATRHVVGRLDVSEVGAWSRGAPVPRLANDLRRLLMAGTASFSAEQRSLFAGLVLGDDREQGPGLAAAFEGAGLTHLLAVSGQNVAFLLAVLAPLLRRLRLWPRFAATLGALGFFALTTRFEPSVLRAVVMAGIGALALTLGRPVSSLQVLCLAVTALLAVDPLLVHQVGFQLSVLATFGIVTLATPIARWLPLPRVVALPAAVTLAAQLATAPLLVARFGPVPVAALPANLLAEPAAAGAMMYGLAAGLVAGALTGLMGPLPAAVIHLPTRVMIWWLAGVARWGAEVPLGHLGGRGLVLLATLALLVAVGAARRRGATTTALCRFRGRRRRHGQARGHGQGPSGTFGSVRAPPADPP